MTSCAMIAGMVPMALGPAKAASRSAPLGRAVIGGLAAASLSTLLVLPAVFATCSARAKRHSASIDPFDPASIHFVADHDAKVLATVPEPNGEPAPRPPENCPFRQESGKIHSSIPASCSSFSSRWPLPARAAPALAGAVEPGSKQASKQNQPAAAQAAAATRVDVVQPQRRTIRQVTQEPGQVEAYEVTPIYAKVAGYVAKWNVDIGSKVAQGQVLAVLSVPELEAESSRKKPWWRKPRPSSPRPKRHEEVARANLASAQARATEVQAGIKHSRSRPRPLASRDGTRRAAF